MDFVNPAVKLIKNLNFILKINKYPLFSPSHNPSILQLNQL